MKKRIVIVLHQEASTTGRVGMKLIQKGYQLDIRKPALGEPLPKILKSMQAPLFLAGQ